MIKKTKLVKIHTHTHTRAQQTHAAVQARPWTAPLICSPACPKVVTTDELQQGRALVNRKMRLRFNVVVFFFSGREEGAVTNLQEALMEVATTCVRCGNVAIKIAIASKSKSDAFTAVAQVHAVTS